MIRKNLLQEQLDYYRARAAEYDASLESMDDSGASEGQPGEEEWTQAVNSLLGLGPCERVLELAGGTGIWTKELTRIAKDLTVLDGSPEMLEINRLKINHPKVRYERADLFDWVPEREYDLVFFAFWLSHVPPELVEPFLDKMQRAVSRGGYVFIVDEPAGGKQVSGLVQEGMYQQRTLQDGRTFNIVKVYYDPKDIQYRLGQRGFVSKELKVGEYFFHLITVRRNE
jgi:ubiquinone/menaquinone biosynthesis C-methylase UbiE